MYDVIEYFGRLAVLKKVLHAHDRPSTRGNVRQKEDCSGAQFRHVNVTVKQTLRDRSVRFTFCAMHYIVSLMQKDAIKGIRPLRSKALPVELRRALIEARQQRGWSQRDLASRLGIGQRHVSGIESGKIVPRYDTLLEIVRMLGRDLIMVPRALVPVVLSLVRDHLTDQEGEGEERSLYAADRDYDSSQEPRDEV
jgi:transcriptional regulator with XRE-family HTH domain